MGQYERMELIYGKEAVERLRSKRVAVFGLGGVGGNAVEALARSGVGTLVLIDNDKVCPSNLNRQLLATWQTVGQYKVDAASDRIHQLDPDICVIKHRLFFLPNTSSEIDFKGLDYCIDAIDTVSGKLEIIRRAKEAGVPVISCMGCGNRTDPSKLQVTDLFKTSQDPLARVMRRELRRLGVGELKVVCSTEPARKPAASEEANEMEDGKKDGESLPDSSMPEGVRRRAVPGSNAFVPPAAGILAASVVVNQLIL